MPQCGGISLTSVQIAGHPVERGLVLVCLVARRRVRASWWRSPHLDAVLAGAGTSKATGSNHKDRALVDQEQLARLVPRLNLNEQQHASALVQHVLHLVGVREGRRCWHRFHNLDVLLTM